MDGHWIQINSKKVELYAIHRQQVFLLHDMPVLDLLEMCFPLTGGLEREILVECYYIL